MWGAQSYLRLLVTTFSDFGEVFGPGEHQDAQQRILEESREIASRLEDRARIELDALPFAT